MTAALAVVTSFTFAPAASAATDPVAAAEAQVTAAQRVADTAAAAYDAAQTKYYQLEHDAEVTRASISTMRAEKLKLAGIVRARAVAAYETGSNQLDVISGSRDFLEAARRTTFIGAANADSDQAIARLGALDEDLRAREAALGSALASQRQTLEVLRAQEADVQRALEDAQQAVQDLRARLERERRAREFSAALARAQRNAAASVETASSSSGSDSSSSSGSAGQIIGAGDWVCPVQGAVSFTDTYGAPRGGGRTHKGVDMFAARGTPIVAVVSGSMFFQSDTLGGLAAYVTGSDNTTYYYAHLDDYVGGDRTVSAGELIGHVGNTGDASDAPPHLHFEIRPGGPNGSAIDPYPTVRAHC